VEWLKVKALSSSLFLWYCKKKKKKKGKKEKGKDKSLQE
jgi:hypothetical protein